MANNSKLTRSKITLMKEIKNICYHLMLKQEKVAEIAGISQPRVSDLFIGRHSKFTLDSLFSILNSLGYDVLITVKIQPVERMHDA